MNMCARGFDAFARRAAPALTRRRSLLALGGAALGVAAPTAPAAGKKGRGKKRRGNKDNGKCAKQLTATCDAQITECQTFFQEFCEAGSNDPDNIQECIDANNACCQEFGRCDLGAYLECLARLVQ